MHFFMVNRVAIFAFTLVALSIELTGSDSVKSDAFHTSFDSSDSDNKRHRRLSDTNDEKLASLQSARKSALSALNLIHQRFEFDTPRLQALLVGANVPFAAWDIIKYKAAKKFVEAGSTFKFIFGGSSVTAGHDNYYNQSYPSVFERRVSDVFKALKIDLQVHNIAHGTNKCKPSDLCFEASGGYGADWIGWEQSFDCGRDKGIFELIARVAYWNKAVIHYSASGGFSPTNCAYSTDAVPWISENWTPELEPSLKNKIYSPDADKIAFFKNLTNDFYQDENSVSRFSGGLEVPYKGTAPHGYSIWSTSKSMCYNDITGNVGCNGLEIMGDCQGKKGGTHWMTKEASMFGMGGGASHHPPAGMHLIRGEFLAYNYLHIFLDTINMLEKDIKSSSNEALSKVYQSELDILQPQVLPAATHCLPECATRPTCFTSYLPNWNKLNMLENVITGDLEAGSPGWNRIAREPGHTDKMGYKDVKVFYETTKANATINIKVEIKTSDYIRICGDSAVNSMKNVIFYLIQNTATAPKQNVLPEKTTQWMHRKYAGDECTLLSGLPKGQHVLSLVCTKEGDTCALTHLVQYE